MNALTEQLNLFLDAEVSDCAAADREINMLLSTEEKIQRALDRIRDLLLASHSLCVSYSGGKDSTVTLVLVLEAAKTLKASCTAVPPIVVTHANTGIENPAYQTVINSELARIKAYAAREGLPLHVDVATPALNDSWAVRIISGRALPTFANSASRDCSIDWKIRPQTKQRKAVLKELGALGDPVVVLGTRYEESEVRARRMAGRGEADTVTWEMEGKRRVGRLAPIAFWTQEDVWTFLSDLTAGRRQSYTDAVAIWEAYRDGGGTSCAVVSDDAMKASAKACGARFGCALCVAVGRDKSLEAMIDSDPKYAYLKTLNRLQRFIVDTQYDLSRRNWLGRTINKDGYVAITPDTYSPAMQVELLRYALTADADEAVAAARLGIAPRFNLVNLQQLIAIDCIWSIQGNQVRPFEAIRVWKEIAVDGMRYYPPQIPGNAFPPVKMPAPQYLHVGRDWDEGFNLMFTGLRDRYLELASEDTDGCGQLRTLSDGRSVMDVGQAEAFAVDIEGACLFLEFEVLEGGLLERHANCQDPTEGFRYYVRLGTVATSTQHVGLIDNMMRRTFWKLREGLVGLSPEELLARCATSRETPTAEMCEC